MNQIEITKALAAEQHRDRARAASGTWLAALARCCRPTAWARAARRVADAVHTRRRRPATGVACCA
jgi:hypothetical protein